MNTQRITYIPTLFISLILMVACGSDDEEPALQNNIGLDNPITVTFDTDFFGSCDNTVTVQGLDMTVIPFPGDTKCFYEMTSFRDEFDGLLLAPAQIIVDFSGLDNPARVRLELLENCGNDCTFVQLFNGTDEVFNQNAVNSSELQTLTIDLTTLDANRLSFASGEGYLKAITFE